MTVHCWGEDPRGLWTVIVTDNDNNNREHYLEKLTQGDEEDVTRIFLDDTGKHSQTGQLSSKKDHAKDHILKSMEDTAGKIFKESRFVKFAHGKKSRHVRNSPRVKVTKKVKHHARKVKESKTAHLKKHYLKTKTNSKTKINKEKQSWTKKVINPNPNVIKVKQPRKMSKKHATNKLTSKTVLSQSHQKLKAPFKKHDNGGERKKPHKASKQEVNATLTMAHKLTGPFSKSSTSALGNLSRSANATTALGLISQLISEIQKNPLVTKIALEALKNPAIGKLFGIDSSRDTAENIQERLLPTASIKQKTQGLENGSESNGSGSHIYTRIVDGDNVSNVKEKSNHLEMVTPGTINSIKQKHFQVFKILKDNEEDYKNDVSGSGIEGSEMSGSGYYFDGGGSGNEENLKAANHQLINCGGSKNCTGTHSEDPLLSVSNKAQKILEKEENSYEIFDEDDKESQNGEGDEDEVFEDGSRPVGSVEDSEDLIPEFGFDLRAINEPDSFLCNFSAVLSKRSSIVTQRARCVENGTIEKRNDERDKEDKNLAHYLAVDKLKSASGDYNLDSGDDQYGSSSKIDDDGDDNQNISQDDSDEKYNGKDLEVLQEALEDQLSRLSKDPASEKFNKEILARVRDDIKRGDIDDLELLEAQISGGKTDLSRVIRSSTPEDHEIDGLDDATQETPVIFEGYNEEGEDLQRRRISHQALKEKPSQTYYVNPDKYGKVNSGILESWTLILYGTK